MINACGNVPQGEEAKMNTTAAAEQAGVAVATIRTWCRRGAVAAVKQAGRWIINAASLARRIQIGARRMTDKPAELNETLRNSIARARYEYTPRRADKPALAGRYVVACPLSNQKTPLLRGSAVWRKHGLIEDVTVNGRTYYVLSAKAMRIRATLTD
jgi:hypothetical protein